MINGDSSSDRGRISPEPEKSEPDSLEFIAGMPDKLGAAIKSIELSERDLRIIASRDPAKFAYAMDRADQLAQVRLMLGDLLEQAQGAIGMDARIEPVITHALGSAAVQQIRRRK